VDALLAKTNPANFSWDDWQRLIGQAPQRPLLFREVESFSPARHAKEAEAFWQWLAGETEEPARRRELERCCTHSRGPFLGADPDRLYRNARLAFASGVAAGYLRHVHEDNGHPETLLRWLGRAGGLAGDRSLLLAGNLRDSWAAEMPQRLEQFLALLPSALAGPDADNYSRARPRLWLGHWLGSPGTTPPADRHWSVPFGTVDGQNRDLGHLHYLHFHPLPGDVGELLDHPADAFLPVAAD
jgi:hypothetical protein